MPQIAPRFQETFIKKTNDLSTCHRSKSRDAEKDTINKNAEVPRSGSSAQKKHTQGLLQSILQKFEKERIAHAAEGAMTTIERIGQTLLDHITEHRTGHHRCQRMADTHERSLQDLTH